MVTCISRSPEETLALGEAWGRAAEPGWIIGLTGELGSGKTQLIKGLARGLGITVPVLSPTFVLVHEYLGGRLPLFHLDLYRLETLEQIVAGLVSPGDLGADRRRRAGGIPGAVGGRSGHRMGRALDRP